MHDIIQLHLVQKTYRRQSRNEKYMLTRLVAVGSALRALPSMHALCDIAIAARV